MKSFYSIKLNWCYIFSDYVNIISRYVWCVPLLWEHEVKNSYIMSTMWTQSVTSTVGCALQLWVTPSSLVRLLHLPFTAIHSSQLHTIQPEHCESCGLCHSSHVKHSSSPTIKPALQLHVTRTMRINMRRTLPWSSLLPSVRQHPKNTEQLLCDWVCYDQHVPWLNIYLLPIIFK